MLTDRELSWLSFNERVLQEAEDPAVPLLERLFFCGVFSSNLDEFFRVRVASLRSLLRLEPEAAAGLELSPPRLLHEIHRVVLDQQDRYGRALGALREALAREGIRIVDEQEVPFRFHGYVREYFDVTVREHLEIQTLGGRESSGPFLRNGVSYLVVELWSADSARVTRWTPEYALVSVPAPPVSRFLQLPPEGDRHHVMFLDDVIRYNLPRVFPGQEVGRAYAVKLTRDAELHVEDEFHGDLERAIRASLRNRDAGIPSRFLYDMRAPYVLVHRLQHGLGLTEEDMVVGGRYHNLSDYMGFPRFDREDLSFAPWEPHPHPHLGVDRSILSEVAARDQIIHTPYHAYDLVVRFLEEAAADSCVDEVSLTVYRVARDSRVLAALETAAQAGKRVTVFFEVQARFDEESNLLWADRLRASGARVLSSIPGLKVHAKLALVARREGSGRRLYAYAGTGNFNEKTAHVYADHGLFTADPRITGDVEEVFRFLAGETAEPTTRHLLVAPFTLRSGLERLISEEEVHAREGRPSGITVKLNALEDPRMIRRLERAALAGVPVRGIVRGICRWTPEEGYADGRVHLRSLVDRYLEHARIYRFESGGEDRMYLASADWMTRNLDRRVEVAIPVLDAGIRGELHRLLEIQFEDDTKARVVDPDRPNRYVPRRTPGGTVRAQEAFRDYVGSLVGPTPSPTAG